MFEGESKVINELYCLFLGGTISAWVIQSVEARLRAKTILFCILMENLISHAESENLAIAKHIIETYPDVRLIFLYGNLGAGKTTFAKSICKALGVTDIVQSPTFSIVNTYQAVQGKVYHFDFYRIKSEEEAWDIGYEEYFFSGDYCLIEWGEKIPNLIPSHILEVHIEAQNDESRNFNIILKK